ncbi:MAG TPA: hypothetical protein ENF35_04675 [Aciduliprofundum sp.]|nr:hypothetical protein [Aciduliprofundum sp.]
MLGVYELVLVTTGLTLFLGAIGYAILYEMLQKIYGRPLRNRGATREEVVMCGMEYDRGELTAPTARVFTMIMSKAFPRGHGGFLRTFGTVVLNDWFAWMLAALALIVALAVAWGW